MAKSDIDSPSSRTAKHVDRDSPAQERDTHESPKFSPSAAAAADEDDEDDTQPVEEKTTEPPLPDEEPPTEDDGWAPVWDATAQAYYFYNRFTQATQWENPRVPEATATALPSTTSTGLGAHDRIPPGTTGLDRPTGSPPPPARRVHGGYNPAIHGDYDPNADYAQEANAQSGDEGGTAGGDDPNAVYGATGAFNRFTGRWQAASLTAENFNDENKSKRQMNAFFDVDAAANSHDGRSLKAERAGKKLSKKEVKAFREKRREKKEEKRRAWLRD